MKKNEKLAVAIFARTKGYTMNQLISGGSELSKKIVETLDSNDKNKDGNFQINVDGKTIDCRYELPFWTKDDKAVLVSIEVADEDLDSFRELLKNSILREEE